jgi:hypothetical protein
VFEDAPGYSLRYLGCSLETGRMRGGLPHYAANAVESRPYFLPPLVGVEMMGWGGRMTYLGASSPQVTAAAI